MAFVAERTPRRTGLWVGAILLVVALLAVVVIALGGGDGRDKSNTGSPSGGKSRPASEETGDTLTADEVAFSDIYGAQIPSSPAGPSETTGGRGYGFSHSHAGAVLAAAHIFARSESRAGPAVFAPTITQQVVGPDKEKLLEKAQQGYAVGAVRGTAPDGSLASVIAEGRPNRVGMWAYRIDAYDESAALVNLLLRQVVPGTTSFAYFNFSFAMRWVGGDWRLVAPVNGEFSTAIRQLPEVPPNYIVVGQN